MSLYILPFILSTAEISFSHITLSNIRTKGEFCKTLPGLSTEFLQSIKWRRDVTKYFHDLLLLCVAQPHSNLTETTKREGEEM